MHMVFFFCAHEWHCLVNQMTCDVLNNNQILFTLDAHAVHMISAIHVHASCSPSSSAVCDNRGRGEDGRIGIATETDTNIQINVDCVSVF